MKKLSIILPVLLIAASTFAQTTTNKKKYPPHPPVHPTPAPMAVQPKSDEYSVMNKNFLDPGVGLGTYYQGLPFGASFEHGFTDDISAGVFIDYSTYSDFYKLNIVYGGVRGSYHFAKLFNVTNPKFDPYAGVSLGYYNVSYSYGDSGPIGDPYASSVLFGVHAGARYMFSDNIGGFAEVGYGVAAVQVGLSFKF